MEGLASLLPLILVLIVFWLFLIRPARNRQRDVARVQGSLEPGQRVVTSAGLFATVRAVEEDQVVLEVAPGVHSRYARAAVVRILDQAGAGEVGPGDRGPEDTGPADTGPADAGPADSGPGPTR